MTRSDAAGLGLALLLAGLFCCALKLAFPVFMADWAWWEVALGPAIGFVCEFVILFAWFFATDRGPK